MKNTIKKILVMALVMMSAIFVFADANDALLVFSTKGPDRYADGTAVQAGECYALVWVRNGAEFAGVDMNGKANDEVNNKVVVAMPLAKANRRGDVHCPTTLFQINAEFASTHADGTFSLVLLDTRVSDGKGGLVPSGNANQVQGWGLVENSRIKAVTGAMGSKAEAGAAGGTVSAVASEIPANADLPRPRITGISVENGFVKLTVKGTSSRLLYNIAASDANGRIVKRHTAAAVQGLARADREITIVTPVSEGQNFFKVVRN